MWDWAYKSSKKEGKNKFEEEEEEEQSGPPKPFEEEEDDDVHHESRMRMGGVAPVPEDRRASLAAPAQS